MLKKFIILLSVFSIIGGIIISSGTNYVYANTNSTQIYTNDEYETAVEKLAVLLQIVTEQANKNGKEIGTFEEYNNAIEKVLDTNMKSEERSLESFGDCVLEKLHIKLASEVVKTIFNKEIVSLLKSHSYKVASSMIFKILSKKLGKKVASTIIKKFAGTLIPGIGWVSLGITVGRCLPRL